jgi:hypothetical protein
VNKLSLRVLPALIAMVGMAPPATRVGAAEPGQPIAAVELDVVERVNAERSAVGLARLGVNYSLMDAAWSHSSHMRAIGRICHSGCGDGDPGSRISATGYQWSWYGENVAAGFGSASAVVEAWMASPGHRANILKPEFTDIGVAVIDGYWTQVFARPARGYQTVTPPAGAPGGPTVAPPTTATGTPTSTVTPRPTPTATPVSACREGRVPRRGVRDPRGERWPEQIYLPHLPQRCGLRP